MNIETSLSEQEAIRRQSLDQIRSAGIDPYPAALYPVNASAKNILSQFADENAADWTEICLAGRLMSKRIQGKASFAVLMQDGVRIQLYVNRDEICPGEDKDGYNQLFKKWLDIGDIIGVKGYVFRTMVGEITLHVQELTLLSKCLRPLPIVKTDAEGNVHDAFSDPELRHRMRYVDLIVNPEIRATFIARSRIISAMRSYFDAKGWLEVETPILQSVHGGAAARPFKTHHQALDVPLFLRIANELYLKRLLVAGLEGVYEIGKMFRNEGMDKTHNPEFTSMEIYVAYKDYEWMMAMVEDCLAFITRTVFGTTEVNYAQHKINFEGPFARIPLFDAIHRQTGTDISGMNETELRQQCATWNIPTSPEMGKGKLIDQIFGEKVEKTLIQPTYITDYPIEMTPLAKKHRNKDGLVERFELFICGKEVANAYTELNDPIDQRQRFEEQLALANRGDADAMALDEDFLKSMEFAMPPASGLGIGIDRLVMMMTNQTSIQEVLFFPQMRPEAGK
ncbi:MAG: lysine--tRNA ligase [Bacteroidetes bacterium]|nr:lysine--tRNA ligase [Bacteroidota bacterium]